MTYGIHSEELNELYRETTRAVDKLESTLGGDLQKLELRLERMEHFGQQLRGKAAGEFARRSDFERLVEEFDEFRVDVRESLASIQRLIKLQQAAIEELTFKDVE